MRSVAIFCVLTVAVAQTLAAQAERHAHGAHGTGLGEVTFANTGAPAAQEPFLRGLALLHSFEYEEAAESFRAAQQADAKFAMAYWGEALTYAHLLWGEDDAAGARRALARLAPAADGRLARAGSARERAYGAAVEALFAETDAATRVRAFADSMRQVVAQYPDDADAVAFAALALMFKEYVGRLPADQRSAARAEAIALAERVFRSHPRHPGSTHYLIHATDDPAHAARGLAAAQSYARLAPEAEHALHMPSHIFLQLGMWPDVVASNERAWAASRAEVVTRKLSNADLSFHTLQWLQYGYLQQGRYRASQAIIDTARTVLANVDLSNPLHVDARFTVHWLEFMQAAHTGDWPANVCRRASQPASVTTASSDRERSFQSIAQYQAAVAAALCGAAGAPALQSLRAVEAIPPNDPALPILRTAQLHADAIAAYGRGEYARAIELLQPAAAEPARPPVGPPPGLRVHELLAAALLKAGRTQEAAAAYERALQLTPNRSLALLGLARARAAAGQRAGA
ncbi:MAG: tetratricopeptide repeat protein, partial [Longimicrobiales bacterium]